MVNPCTYSFSLVRITYGKDLLDHKRAGTGDNVPPSPRSQAYNFRHFALGRTNVEVFIDGNNGDRRKQAPNKVLRLQISCAHCPASSLLLGPAQWHLCPLKLQAFSLRLFTCGLLFHFLPSSHEQQSALFPQQVYSLPNLASPPILNPRAGAVDLFISMVLKAYDNIQQKILNL